MIDVPVGAARTLRGGEAGQAAGTPAPPEDGTGPTGRRHAGRWGLAGAIAALALYALGAWALYGFSSWAPAGRIDVCSCSDQIQEVWFLAWPAYALSHGQSILASTWMNWPHGFNMMENTSMPALGVLGTPVTLLAGPVATYNLLLHLGPTLSAFAMFLVARRWARWWPAAFAGGLAFGFSTFMIGQSQGHAFLTFAPLLPVLLWLLDEALVRRRRSPLIIGAGIGAVAAVELLISSEVLAMAGVVAVAGVVALTLAGRSEVRAALPYVARVGAAALVVGGVLAAVPLWYLVSGPQHIAGPPHPLRDLVGIPGDLLGAVAPTSFSWVTPASWARLGDRLTSGDLTENGEYLGIPLIVALTGLAVAFRRRGALLYFIAMAGLSWVLSLGAHLTVDGQTTHIPLPGLALAKIPLVQDIVMARFTLLEWLFVATALALGLDELHRALAGHRATPLQRITASPRWMTKTLSSVIPLAIAVTVAVPLVPRTSMFPSVPTDVPAFYTSPAIRAIPPNSVVLDYPYPTNGSVQGLAGQAVAGMRYKVMGGYAFVPGGNGRSSWLPAGSMFQPLWQIFVASFQGGAAEHAIPPLDPSTTSWIRDVLGKERVSTVIVEPVGADPHRVVRYLTAALGPPQSIGGVTAWFDVPRLVALRPPPA